MDMVLITASIIVTGLTDITDIGHIVITDTGLMDISAGAVVITGVAVTAEVMGGEEYMVAAGGVAGAEGAMAGEDTVGIETEMMHQDYRFNQAEMDK